MQRRVLVTGAGSGLGRALAQRYAASGAAVCCVDLHRERAEETLALLPGRGHLALQADVGSDQSMQALASTVATHWDGVDVLVNNAGIASGGPLLDAPIEEWREVLEINLLGVVRGCQAFLPGMVARRAGQVVNIASFAAIAAAPNIMSYGVAKAGVLTLSEQLRAEMHPHGVVVSVACPAFFRTNLLQSWRGSQRMRGFAERMMETSVDSLDEVADRLFAAAERGDFLILPTRREKGRWRIKRFFPEWYFRKLMAMTRAAGGGRKPG
jgi:NAD(P)-dependent dehydrogenase (short-subunit alcohol dehydrogenase family)